jgi:WD40 repeat protein/tetratricopeptide (TPR) repeat protein
MMTIHPRVHKLLRQKADHERASYIEMVARQSGAKEFADAIASSAPNGEWSAPWAHWQREHDYFVIGNHHTAVTAIAAAAIDGEPIAVSGDEEGLLQLWTLKKGGAPLGEPMDGHTGRIQSVAICKLADRSVAVSASEDRTLRIWDIGAAQQIGTALRGHGDVVRAVAVGDLEGRRIAVSGSDDGTLRIWDLASRMPIGEPLRGHEGSVRTIAVGEADGRLVAVSGGDDRTVRVWDLRYRKPLGDPIHGHECPVVAVAMGDIDGQSMAVSASQDQTLRLWSTLEGRSASEPLGYEYLTATPQDAILALDVVLLAARPTVVAGSNWGIVWLWDIGERTLVDRLRARPVPVTALSTIEIAGRPMAVSGSCDGVVRMFDLRSDRLDPPQQYREQSCGAHHICAPGLSTWVHPVAFARLEERMVALTSIRNIISVWDLQTGQSITENLIGTHGYISGLAIVDRNPGSRLLASTDRGSLTLWHLDEKPIREEILSRDDDAIVCLASGEVGGETKIISGHSDGTVRVRNMADARSESQSICAHEGGVLSVSVTECAGQGIAATVGADDKARVWDLSKLELLWELESQSVLATAFATLHGKPVVVFAMGSSVAICDIGTGEPLASPFRGHEGPVHSLATGLLDSRSVVISGGYDRTIRIWDLQSAQQMMCIDLDSSVHALSLGPMRTVLAGQFMGVTAIRLGDRKSTEIKPNRANVLDSPDTNVAERGQFFLRLGGRYQPLAEEAVVDFNIALKKTPSSVDIITARGRANRISGRNAEARKDYNRSLEIAPTHFNTLVNRGYLHRISGNVDQALRDFNKAVRSHGESPWVLANRSMAYAACGRYREALVDADRAVHLDPSYEWARTYRAAILRCLGRYDDALSDLDRSVSLDPHGWGRELRGDTLRLLGRFAEAASDLRVALTFQASDEFILSRLGETCRMLGGYDDALTYLNTVLDTNSSHILSLASRGSTNRHLGRFEDALVDLNEAIRLCADYGFALRERGATHCALGHDDAAADDFASALEVNTDDVAAVLFRGVNHTARGRYADALEDFERVIDALPQEVEGHCSRADSLASLGRIDAALSEYMKCVCLAPRNPKVYNRYGIFLSRQGNYKAADEAFAAAIDLAPSVAAYLANRAVLHLRTQDYHQAVETFRNALRLDPNDPLALAGCGEGLLLLGELDDAERFLELSLAARAGSRETLVLSAVVHACRQDAAGASSRFRRARSMTSDPDCTPFRSAEVYALALAGSNEVDLAIDVLRSAVATRLPGDTFHPRFYALLMDAEISGAEQLRMIAAR